MLLNRESLQFHVLLALSLYANVVNAQKASPENKNTYTIDLDKANIHVLSGHLKLGTNRNAKGEELNANSFYFLRNGKPWYPVMGEFHFSRYPRKYWEESILKMKACGIDVIASYIFWIHHEEEEGRFDWTGDRDLRFFTALCAKHNMKFFVRIGPWCHGEVRNGGFPDWLLKKGNLRKNYAPYLEYVKRFYNEIGKQLQGFYFKDGGPVMGCQIENEYSFKSAEGLKYMLALKELAVLAGIDTPYYTATGWPDSDQQQSDLILVWGAYPEAPWDPRTLKLPLLDSYLFGPLRNDPAIGSDILGKQQKTQINEGYRYPYTTAEMGGGNQITYHRRPVIQAPDVTALSYVKIGSGANLIGYYMFHGGSNPIGKLSTMQESRATRYQNDYPIISYDFYAPIGEWGQLRPSYRSFKVLHTFLNEFGDRLAPMYPAFPDIRPSGPGDDHTLRLSVRSKDKRGFVFISQFQRQLPMKIIPQAAIKIKLKNSEVVTMSSIPLAIGDAMQMILPFNMDVEGATLRYATAQPLCRLSGDEPVFVFFAPGVTHPKFVFDITNIRSIKANNAKVIRDKNTFIITGMQPGTECVAEIILAGGKKLSVLTLSNQQALNAWKAYVFGKERLFISEDDLIFTRESIKAQSTGDAEVNLSVFPDTAMQFTDGIVKRSADGMFTNYRVTMPAKQMEVTFREIAHLHTYLNREQQIPLDNRLDTINYSRPGPQYQTILQSIPGARNYSITIPALFNKPLADAFLTVDYTGDTGAAYLDGKLITDDFYAGLPMLIGLKRFGDSLSNRELILQIVPLTDERDIYFESGVREPLKGRSVADIKSVSLKLQYETTITGR